MAQRFEKTIGGNCTAGSKENTQTVYKVKNQPNKEQARQTELTEAYFHINTDRLARPEELLLWLMYLFGGEGGRQILLHLLPLGLAEVVVCRVLKVGLDLHAHTRR